MQPIPAKLIYIPAAIVVAATASVYFLVRKPSLGYTYDLPQRASITQSVEMTGKVQATQNVDLSFDRTGRIGRVSAKVGDVVKAGQELVALDNADAAATLAQAQDALNKQLAGNTPEYIAGLQASLDKANADLSLEQGADLGVDSSKSVSNAYDDMKANLQNVQNILSSGSTTADNILGIDNALANDGFRTILSIQNPSIYNSAPLKYQNAKLAKQTFDTAFNSLGATASHADVDRIAALGQSALGAMKDLLFTTSAVLDNTPANGPLTPAALDGMKSTVLATRNNVAARTASLVASVHVIDAARSNYFSLQALAAKAAAALKDAQNPPRAVDVASYRASVALAAANYNKTIIRAPFDGVVARQDAKVGTAVVPNVPLVSLVSQGQLQIEGYVTEADIAAVHTGATANVQIDSVSGTVFPATVASVAPAPQSVGDGTSAYKVIIQLTQPDNRVQVGETATVTINGETKNNVLVIPQHDVLQRSGHYFVTVKSGSQFIEREVVVGVHGNGDTVEIISGLTENDSVVGYGSNN